MLQSPSHRTNSYNPTHHQLACQCKRTDQGTVYFDVPTHNTPAVKPTHCPVCTHQHVFRDYDYADVLCTTYYGLTRTLACQIITSYNEFTAREALPPSLKSMDPLEYIIKVYPAISECQPMSQSPMCAPLSISCTDCAGEYILYAPHSSRITQRTPPLHCVWCGSQNTVLSVQSTDEAWFTRLSILYSLPPILVKALYTNWSTTLSSHSSFSDYVHSPSVQQAIASLNTQSSQSVQ